MVRAEVIRKRLNKLDEYLSILHRIQKYDYEEFVSNPERYGSAERFLHLAIEVHEYIEIDRKIVYQVLQNNLKDIEELRRVFAQFL